MSMNKLQIFLPGRLAVLTLASALSLSVSATSAGAQQTADGTSTPTPSATQPSPSAQGNLSTPPKEGFWGRVNPFARKKWVNRQLEPIKGQLNELDEVNAKNANDIRDVDSRARAGIQKAQGTADSANRQATAAGEQAQRANTTALAASTKVEHLNGTIGGLDQYAEMSTVSIAFRRGTATLTPEAKRQLDDLAAKLNGQQGYLLEVEAHAPEAGAAGIQSSERLAEAVKRYLVVQHEIPIYRMHAVALGNSPAVAANATPAKSNYVELRWMENSLAAQDGSTPQLGPSQTGAVQP